MRFSNFAVAVCLSWAIALVGLAHKIQEPVEPVDAAVQAYLDSGGSLSDICASLGKDGAAFLVHCEACLIKNGLVLPKCIDAPWIALFGDETLVTTMSPSVHPDTALDLSRASRAPPFV
ncbi:MAG: hypothetical protein AAGK67_11015 [Pseudomonadota bacterium]